MVDIIIILSIFLNVQKHFVYFRRTVRDLQTGQDVVLSDKDVELIQRIESSKIPDSTYEDYAVFFLILITVCLKFIW